MDENETLRLGVIGVGIKAEDALARVERVERLLLTFGLVLVTTLLLLSWRDRGGGWGRGDDDGPPPSPAPVVEEVEQHGRA